MKGPFVIPVMILMLAACRKEPDVFNLANEAARNGKHQEAIDLYTQAIGKDAGDFYAYLYRGRQKLMINDTLGALSDFKAASGLNSRHHTPYALIADIHYAQKAYGKAKEYYAKAASNDPRRDSRNFYNTAVAKERTGEVISAMFEYDRALVVSQGMDEALYNRANVKQSLGDFKGAIEDYDQLLKLDPLFAEAYFNRGLLHVEFGRDVLAFKDFSVAIELDPSYSDSYVNRGNLHFKDKRYEAALEDFNQALEFEPTNAHGYFGRALTRYILGDHQGALVDFDKSLTLDTISAAQFFHRGSIKKNLGDTEGALGDYGIAGAMGFMLAFDSIQLTNEQLEVQGITQQLN